jgi:hypothetical protein
MFTRKLCEGMAHAAPVVYERYRDEFTLRHRSDGRVFAPASEFPPPLDTTVDVLVGAAEHAPVLDELVALIQSPGHEGEVLYQDHADYLRALYDETAISFCTTICGRICGVLTVHMAHTEWGDLVSYASMLKVRTSLTNVSIDGERSSHLLIAAWMRYVDRLMPVRGTAHLVTQSVGYKYILEAGMPVCVPSDTHKHGFHCWRNHLFEPATNAAITFGFLLGIAKGPEFLDPDCCILYRTLRKSGAFSFFSLSLCARRCMWCV